MEIQETRRIKTIIFLAIDYEGLSRKALTRHVCRSRSGTDKRRRGYSEDTEDADNSKPAPPKRSRAQVHAWEGGAIPFSSQRVLFGCQCSAVEKLSFVLCVCVCAS